MRILKDEIYTGTLVQGRQRKLYFKSKVSHRLPEQEWTKTENTHPPIISKLDYEAVQRALVLDSRTMPELGSVHPLSGILTCGHCGGRITRKTVKSNGKLYHYYHCPTPKAHCCLVGMIPEKQMEGLVLQGIQKHIVDVKTLLSQISHRQTDEAFRQEQLSKLAVIEEKIHRTLNFQLSLQNSLAAKVIAETEYRALLNFYEAELCRLHEESWTIQRKLISDNHPTPFNAVWKDSFLSFTNLSMLDRKTVLLTVEQIRLLSKTEIEIRFTYQSEFEQAVGYLEQKREM